MATKSIAIYNVKGGVGKSTVARELAFRLNATLVDCDHSGVQDAMDAISVVSAKGEIIPRPDEIDAEAVIYDFAGKNDSRSADILGVCDIVAIPYTPSFYAIQNTADSFLQVWKSNKNVILVANYLREDKDLARSKDELEEFLNNKSPDIGEIMVFPLHFTRGLQTAENIGTSIFKLRDQTPINKLNYKKVCSELDDMVDVIKEVLYAANSR